MSTELKPTNVEEVLPNDEDLGRRNCRWRELVQKYEEAAQNHSDHSMDIDTAMVMLDQDMSDESSVSDVVEASSEEQSPAENIEEIQRQLKEAVPLRKREWEANGLKEILDDNEFRMLSHEKVENWLRNHMHSITGHYNVHYHQTEQVTTVTETCMDADADSLYSVDTAQYIRSNKQSGNKLKVTTMIKQYSVTSSVRRLTSLGIIVDEQKSNQGKSRLSLPLPRTLTKSDSACEIKQALPQYSCSAPRKTVEVDSYPARLAGPPSKSKQTPAAKATTMVDRPNRRRVFKKTIVRKRPGASCDRATVASARQRHNVEQVYSKALELYARQKRVKPISERKVSKQFARQMRYPSSTSSSESDSDDVFFAPRAARDRLSPSSPVKPLSKRIGATKATCSCNTKDSQQPAPVVPPAETVALPDKATSSSTEREIVGPFQSITLGASKRQRAQPAEAAPAVSSGSEPAKKKNPVPRFYNGVYFAEGMFVYQPETIRPDAPSTEKVRLRVGDLTLTGITKQRHLDKFQAFDYHVHVNSSVCFYPTESSEPDDESSDSVEIDPICAFRSRDTDRLHVVEIPYRPNAPERT